MSGPGAALAEELLSQLEPRDIDLLDRWGDGKRDWITGFFFGRFGYQEHSPMALSNAARALTEGEVTL